MLIFILFLFCLVLSCDDDTLKEDQNSINVTTENNITSNDKCKQGNMICIENLKKSKDHLLISYIVKNDFKHDIWICRDIDVHGNFTFEVESKDEVLCIKLKLLDIPSDVFFSQSILARYTRLSSGNTLRDELAIGLPAKQVSPFFPLMKKTITLKELSKLNLQIGYFDINLLDVSDSLINKVSDNEVHIDSLWEGKKIEKVFELGVSDVKVPYFVE